MEKEKEKKNEKQKEKEKKKKDEIADIPTKNEESEKAKKLRAAPDEVIAKALHEMIIKDHEI